jgi:hypothetical protein
MTIMRKTYTLIVMLAMLFVGANSVSAQITVDELIYTISSGKAYVNGVVDATQTDITIPASITYDKGGTETTVPVVGIYPSAFKDNAVLENVHVLTNTNNFSFQASCFAGCTTLQKVTFENNKQGRTYMSRAFKGCINLTQIGNTANVVQLASNYDKAEEVFSGCTSIQQVTYRFVQTNIGKEWFKGCVGINTIDFGSAMNIGESAFEGCTSIPNVRFRTSSSADVYSISIGKNAFKGCTSIAHIYTHQEKRPLSAIGEGAFEGCTSLTAIRNWYINSNGNYSENALTGITTIGARAFYGCTVFTRFGNSANTAIFQNDLAEIGASAFEGCAALNKFYLYKMDAAPTLGEDAFTGIASDAVFYIYPNNSYTAAGKYALDAVWKTFFDGTKANYTLFAYVNKSKQYGTVSCDVPLYFRYVSAAGLYKVVAADDSYSYLKAVSTATKRKLPANTGAVVEVGTQTSGDNAGQLYPYIQVQVLFDGSETDADFEGNLLKPNVTETNFVGNEGNTWNLILSNGKFVKATDGTLAAGLAYLPVTFEGGEAKELSLTTDEPTGIKTIDNGEPTVDNGAWYTIDGTRLQGEPTMKGIYIKNGKKIVVK